MPRRVHVPHLTPGDVALDAAQSHHVRDVLRLTDGADVEVFDDAGRVARGRLHVAAGSVSVRVDQVTEPGSTTTGVRLTIASAVPKGDRADWMVEKLSELGVAEFIPLAAVRSVVLPEGKNKRERWVRIATEAAKQSRRGGVMQVGELTKLADALAHAGRSWHLATEQATAPIWIAEAAGALAPGTSLCAFVGPEGGWTEEELAQFGAAGSQPVRLTDTILRVETAAIAAAAVIRCLLR